MILNVSHLAKAFAGSPVIRDASFFLNEHDKAAIVGLNGTGKSTLLNLITGELPADSGIVTFKKDCRVGYLHQNNNIDSALTVREELTQVIQPILDMEARLAELQEAMKHASGEDLDALYREYERTEHAYETADGYQARSRVNGVLNGLGFTEEEAGKRMHDLSGGQKTRVFLGKLLLEQPDIILLDEPTNHLDLRSIEWLETWLMNFSGAVVIVSHDRYFLDRIVNRVFDIENGIVNGYEGNYTRYAEKKAEVRASQLRAYLNQQAEIRHQEEVIRKLKSFNREKSIKRAESREKMLNRVERLERPTEEKADMALSFSMLEESGNDVLQAEGLAKSFGSQELFRDVSFELKRGEHVAIIGDNGTGKTTILKIINGLLAPDAGSVTLGARVLIAYYDQEHAVLHPEKTLFEELQDTWPDMNNTEVRSMLAAFLFTGDDVFKRIADLSGGERGRVSLAKLMLSQANLLILDEPTNHLDIVSKEILEDAIRRFPGTVLYVSHDRYFINRTATRILDLTGKKLLNYIGNYDYYLEKKADVERAAGIMSGAGNLAGDAGSARLPGGAGGLGGSRNTGAAGNGAGPSSGCSGFPGGSSDTAGGAVNSARADWELAKAQKAAEKKRKQQLEKCENRIHELETVVSEVEDAFSLPENQRDAAKLLTLQRQKEAAEAELETLYEEWEALASEDDV